MRIWHLYNANSTLKGKDDPILDIILGASCHNLAFYINKGIC